MIEIDGDRPQAVQLVARGVRPDGTVGERGLGKRGGRQKNRDGKSGKQGTAVHHELHPLLVIFVGATVAHAGAAPYRLGGIPHRWSDA